MQENKVYVLQQNLPGVKAGREIVNEGLFVFREPTTPAERMYRFKEDEIKLMPDWFKLKEVKEEERIVLTIEKNGIPEISNNIKYTKERYEAIISILNEVSENDSPMDLFYKSSMKRYGYKSDLDIHHENLMKKFGNENLDSDEFNNRGMDKVHKESSNVRMRPESPAEKDYEIISYSPDNGRTILTTEKYGKTWASNNTPIHSVLRKSDNTVFTLGDMVCFRIETNPNWRIDNFLLKEDGTLLARSNSSDHCEFVDKDLLKINQIKPILFTTEDGVDIYEYTDITLHHLSPNYDISFSNSKFLAKQNRSFFKIFSTKSKAEEYILQHRPLLISLNDLLSVWDKGIFGGKKQDYTNVPLYKIFEQLFKDKTKNT